MNPDPYRAARDIFLDAITLEGRAREEFVRKECGDNEALMEEVRRLLAGHDKTDDSFILADILNENTKTGDVLTFAPGARIGHYEILEVLGVSLGEVYRAQDLNFSPPKLVAIKTLPRDHSNDADRVARFQREANVLAALTHPNIGAIHGVIPLGEARPLVLEWVEGETLAARIGRGAIPLGEALGLARQIADALEYAHDKGVVHRDLKPANIMIGTHGHVKVLDFGLAKAFNVDIPGNASRSITAGRKIMGTAAYMSPEQAAAKDVDSRSDIWAFGCLLYEMLTGRPLFAGETLSEILAEVLKAEPDFSHLSDSTPESIRRLLRRCLQKDRKRRLRHIGDAKFEIEDAESGPLEASPAPSGMSRREWLAWSAAAVGALGTGAATWLARGAATPPPNTDRGAQRSQIHFFQVETRKTLDPVSIAISPDGEKIVFVGNEGTQSHLYLQQPGQGETPRKLEGTEGAYLPFWAPDSRNIGFFAKSGLHTMEINATKSERLAAVSLGRGGSWIGRQILYAANPGTWISRVDVDTGHVFEPVTALIEGHVSHRFPQFVGETHFLYHVTGTPGPAENRVAGIYISDLAHKTQRRLLLEVQKHEFVETALYAPPGLLLFLIKRTVDNIVDRTLFVQDFDRQNMDISGKRSRVNGVDGHVMVNTAIYRAALTVSEACLAYRYGSASGHRQLEWCDKNRKPIQPIGELDGWGPLNPSLSPDGNSVLLNKTHPETGNTNVFKLDCTLGGNPQPLVQMTRQDPSNDSPNYSPVWSKRRDLIFFSNSVKGPWDLYEKSSTKPDDKPRLVLHTSETKIASDSWSTAKDEYILFQSISPAGSYDLWGLRYSDKKPWPLRPRESPYDERDGQFSPDGKWVAYSSNQFDKFEIFVIPFSEDLKTIDEPGARISKGGGSQPRWGRNYQDHTELFYLDPDGVLMCAHISPANGTAIGENREWFKTKIPAENPVGVYGQQYAVFADRNGELRFLLNVPNIDIGVSPLRLIVDVDWKSKP